MTADFDGAAADLLPKLAATGWRAAWYSTYSHGQPGKGLRYRVVVPLSRPVESQDDYADAMAGLVEALGAEGLDPASYNTEHLMFWPSSADPALFEHGAQDGPLADTDDLLMTGDLSSARPRPRPEASYDGPDYDGPGYEHLSAFQQMQARAQVEQAVDWWCRRTAEVADWPERTTDDKGRGWDDIAGTPPMPWQRRLYTRRSRSTRQKGAGVLRAARRARPPRRAVHEQVVSGLARAAGEPSGTTRVGRLRAARGRRRAWR